MILIFLQYDGTRKVNVTQLVYNEPWAESRAPRNRSSFIGLVNHVSHNHVLLSMAMVVAPIARSSVP